MNRHRRAYGALPSQHLRELMRSGFIFGGDEARIGPASLDLTLSSELYEIEGVAQPMPGETVRDLLALIKLHEHKIEEPLRKQRTYLARLNESLRLPEGIYGFCNPKSSTGRIDMHVRVIADRVSRYDTVTPAGFAGELWLVISPRSFPVLIHEGETLTQLRLFNGDTRFNELELQTALREYKLMWYGEKNVPFEYADIEIKDGDGSLILTADTGSSVVGYVCTEPDTVLDIAKISGYEPGEFFEPIHAINDRIALKKDRFYILSSRERIRIPPGLASEMVPMDERSGDFRSHYAGFLDPGWGWGVAGEGFGRPFTLEVRPFEDLFVRAGQPIAKIRFEYMLETPDISYDTRASNYLSQSGPRLGKQFKTR